MSKYKVVVMDMDDTLMNSENKVSPETQSYLIDIQDKGYKVVLDFRTTNKGMIPLREL